MPVIRKAKPLPTRFRMPIWKRFWDWLRHKPMPTTTIFPEDDYHLQKFTYFKDLYDKETKFEVVMGPGRGDDPRGEVLQKVRVSSLSFDSKNGLIVDVAWEKSRSIRTGLWARILGS